jgi:hypothetical protein
MKEKKKKSFKILLMYKRLMQYEVMNLNKRQIKYNSRVHI